MRRALRENGLSIVLLSLFLLFWVGQSVAGHREHNSEQREHMRPEVAYFTYLQSSHFWEATAENWESEFFQMYGYVILTLFLYQKGSSESKSRASRSRWIETRVEANGETRPGPSAGGSAGPLSQSR